MVLADHAALRHVFAKTDIYIKTPAFRGLIKNLLGEGVTWAEHDEHRLHRRVTSGAFSPEAIRAMSDIIVDASEKVSLLNPASDEESRRHGILFELCRRLDTLLSDSQSGEATVNICDHSSTVALDVISRTTFGHDFFPEKYEFSLHPVRSVASA